MKKIFFSVVVLILLFQAAIVSADDLADVRTAGVLRMGTSPDYIPFVFYDDTGMLTGIDAALMEEVGRRMNVQVQVIDIAFDGLIDSLNIGQVDVIGGGFSKTPSREELIDFTRVYYTGDAEFIALSSLPKPQSVELSDFHDLRIGVERGTSFDQWVKTNLAGPEYVDAKNVYAFSNVKEAMKALDRGDVDLVLMDQDLYEDLYRDTGNYQLFYDGFAKENYAFGLRKDSSLTSEIDSHLSDMFKDGTAQAIADRFFQMDFSEAGISRPGQLPTPTPSGMIPTPGPDTSCVNGMIFITDVTITDGHQVYPGEQFRKTWRVQNSGTCTWTSDYSFVFVSGDQMGGQNIYIPAIVAPGQMIDLSVDLTAPYDEGTYRGFWQMRAPWGTNFGQTVWVKVRVKADPAPTDTPEPWYPTPVPTHATGLRVPVDINSFYPDAYSGWEGSCPTVYWNTDGAYTVNISADGALMYSGDALSGAEQLCGPLTQAGQHTVEIYAYNDTDNAYSSFDYTTMEWVDPTPVPEHPTGLITPVPDHPTGLITPVPDYATGLIIPDSGNGGGGFGFGAGQ